jgi:uncharacterized protein (DUF302 family)
MSFYAANITKWSLSMNNINYKREITATVAEAIERATKALSLEGFGVLTRIDMHKKIKEKIDRDIFPTVILGACNPSFAYQAYTINSDVSALLPCNVVVREVRPGSVSVEIVKPSAMLQILGDSSLIELAREGDVAMERVLKSL